MNPEINPRVQAQVKVPLFPSSVALLRRPEFVSILGNRERLWVVLKAKVLGRRAPETLCSDGAETHLNPES